MNNAKVCSKCKKTKPIIEFYKQKSCKDGHRPDCKECHGKPTPPQTIEDKFNKRVYVNKYCWDWIGSVDSHGYGQLWHDGKLILAHRISYELHNGLIPDGMHILHTCDNPSCVKPSHLFTGTHRDNMIDRDKKGRVRHGETHKDAKLNEASVRNIREEYETGNATISLLSKKHGVSPSSIKKVITRKTWSRVS